MQTVCKWAQQAASTLGCGAVGISFSQSKDSFHPQTKNKIRFFWIAAGGWLPLVTLDPYQVDFQVDLQRFFPRQVDTSGSAIDRRSFQVDLQVSDSNGSVKSPCKSPTLKRRWTLDTGNGNESTSKASSWKSQSGRCARMLTQERSVHLNQLATSWLWSRLGLERVATGSTLTGANFRQSTTKSTARDAS